MTVKTGQNKSAVIRDLYNENPNLPVAEAVATLAEKGIKVNKSLVYMVKKRLQIKARRQVKARKVEAVSSNGHGAGDALATIKKVKQLAESVGGMKKLKELVDALNQ